MKTVICQNCSKRCFDYVEDRLKKTVPLIHIYRQNPYVSLDEKKLCSTCLCQIESSELIQKPSWIIQVENDKTNLPFETVEIDRQAIRVGDLIFFPRKKYIDRFVADICKVESVSHPNHFICSWATPNGDYFLDDNGKKQRLNVRKTRHLNREVVPIENYTIIGQIPTE
jgi:hypothetical protein